MKVSDAITLREAREKVARNRVLRMSVSERTEVLKSSWWNIDEHDDRWPDLPKELRDEIERSESLVGVYGPRHDPLLLLAVMAETRGVRAEWLSAEIAKWGELVEVVGATEKMIECNCCGYLTVRAGEDGIYDICPVCFWENDGVKEGSRYSGVNHMTLNQGRNNFAEIGAYSPASRRYVVADPSKMYERAPRHVDSDP